MSHARAVRKGVVAVVIRGGQLLAVRRSARVSAPGRICFPGGGIEQGETEEQALIREIGEELGVVIRPVSRVWQCRTAWRVGLAWWHAELVPPSLLRPNAEEIAEVLWRTPAELLNHADLLESNRDFLHAVVRGNVLLPGFPREV